MTRALSIKLYVVLARCLWLGIQRENNGISITTSTSQALRRALYLGAQVVDLQKEGYVVLNQLEDFSAYLQSFIVLFFQYSFIVATF